MSLQLLTGYGYSSGEDEPAPASAAHRSVSSSDDESDPETEQEQPTTRNFNFSRSRSRSGSDPANSQPPPDPSLPSALDAFAEITGPPDFLNNSVGAVDQTREASSALGVLTDRSRRRRDKRDLPAGAVVEAKPQLVAIRDRVTVDGGNTTSESVTTIPGEGKRKIGAANPGPEDASDLLRMCLQCGVPKTYSHARGMVCPICGDRPVVEPKEAEKKKGSTVKDKEKSKRMRGQSSHATWKSETEMQLRQQFD
ncbi:Protein PRRC2A [Rhynchospora pubera]|uniref:Protein PRRC2A n=1 Tax=Rhynchospora pubera TaxID=906938 RepID=A0AAV8HBH9_9POAL|nr:Protein PRRC2A [Rhynchospora pubera]